MPRQLVGGYQSLQRLHDSRVVHRLQTLQNFFNFFCSNVLPQNADRGVVGLEHGLEHGNLLLLEAEAAKLLMLNWPAALLFYCNLNKY
jgi:hypothetical protein